jgi:4-hydroxy-tetrahydrodipicolinate reductase
MDGLNICIVGANGNMGKSIIEVLHDKKNRPMLSLIIDVDPEKASHKIINNLNISRYPGGIDVVIDFTKPRVTMTSAKWCAENGIPLVTGTTGLSDEQLAELEKFAEKIPIIWSPNMSLGVNLIDKVLLQMMEVLEGYDVEIVETHHRDKPDSPSGTAKEFARILAEVSGRKVVCSRQPGNENAPSENEICVHSIRGGAVPGENKVIFFKGTERVIIEHRVGSLDVFARGAVEAAKWIIGKKPDLYGMADVFEL